MATPTANLARLGEILKFLVRYRTAGVFTGLDLDASVLGEDDVPAGGGDPDAFVRDLESLGPTFVKIGQALSTRPDMVPAPYLAALERMQDRVEPVPFDAIRAVVEDELGARIGRAYAEFDEAPLGSASLAQVHRARLRDGRAVAVKVQRPGIVDGIRTDLDLLQGIAARADRYTDLGHRVGFAEWVHEFRRTLLAELDYRLEAENLERFGALLARYRELVVPQPVWDLTRGRVLTMDRVDGVKATEIGGLRRTEQRFGGLASVLTRAYLDQVFVHGEIHADPHPGNVLVTDDGRLGLLDLGMVAHVPPRQRERLLKLLFAAVDGRGEEVAHECIAMGTRLERFDEERYFREVGQLVSRYAARRGPGLSEGRLVLELTIVGSACRLRTPPELSLLGKTLLNLESVSAALDPELDTKRVVEEHLEHVLRERARKSFSPARLAGEAIELQALVREAPRRVSDILSHLAENRLQVKVVGLDESHLMESIQKVANRVSAGLIVAALIVGSALLLQVPTRSTLFGYPTLAIVMFLAAAALGLGIVISVLLSDRPRTRRETPGLR